MERFSPGSGQGRKSDTILRVDADDVRRNDVGGC
ncbi:hypothetical protein PUN28_011462 [Cardiocondyla obscurior]|uniref:Uncharacterized protein n=1 Tax=Cardiocondyla obscurior TaxID=286306 RepID=A0AAW2FJN9_9HYME